MQLTRPTLLGLIGGLCFGVCLTFALGAESVKRSTYPKYSTQYIHPFLHVTDNESNLMHIYISKPGGEPTLAGTIDLTYTGKPTLKATKVQSPEEQPKGLVEPVPGK